jgi:pyruvate, orthophosphate dikinase
MSKDYGGRVFHIGGGESDADATAAEIGAKGANLGRLDRLGLRIPPALAVTTALSRQYQHEKKLPGGFAARLAASVCWLEEMTGLTRGGSPPLLVSVRSSPVTSMPGMLDTLLNVGLTETTVHGLIRRTGNTCFAWDSYRRLVRAFGELVYHVAPAAFDRLAAAHLSRTGARACHELDAASMHELASESAALLHRLTGEPFPQDPIAQLTLAVEAVLASWNSPRARQYRRENGLDEHTGPAVLVQSMVFGNAGARSGSGVGFTRNPAIGDNELYFDFLFNAQGVDIVSGHEPVPDNALERLLPDVWIELQAVRGALEHEFRDMQDFEFTVEEGRLYFLQTRDGHRTPWAAARIAADLVANGTIDPQMALQRLAAYNLDDVVRSSVRPKTGADLLARATGASIGVATGSIVFDAVRAQQLATRRSVILLRSDISTDDLAAISSTAGILTTFGGRTSHAAVIARQLGKVAVVGCADLHLDRQAGQCVLGTRHLHEGDVITIDGDTGLVYAGQVDAVAERPRAALAAIASWRTAPLTIPANRSPLPVPAGPARQFSVPDAIRTDHP